MLILGAVYGGLRIIVQCVCENCVIWRIQIAGVVVLGVRDVEAVQFSHFQVLEGWRLYTALLCTILSASAAYEGCSWPLMMDKASPTAVMSPPF